MRPKHTRTHPGAVRTAVSQAWHQRLFCPTVLTRALRVFVAAVLFGVSFAAYAETHGSEPELPQAAPRVTAVVDDRVLIPLAGNTHPLTPKHFDLGPVASGSKTGRMRLMLNRGETQDRNLHEFLSSVENPHSPQYHKWLTPQLYGAKFGIADEDLEQVERWLTRAGFKVEGVGAGRNFIQFSGTAGAVERAFHTSLRTYMVAGVRHIGNTADPKVPAALAPVIKGISPLNDFRAVAQGTFAKHTQASSSAEGRPAFVNAADHILYLTPADAATLYDSPNHLNKNFSGSTERTGLGVKLGVAGYSDLAVDDYLNYRRVFLNEISPKQPKLVMDGVDPGVENQHDGQITLINAEIAAALAPGAQIFVYSSNSDLLDDGLTNAIARAIDDNEVSILTVSYARCEYVLGDSGNAAINELWQQAAAQGISVVVAAGDLGSAGCDEGDEASATGGLAVNGLASTPYDLAVGGTDFDVLAQGFGTFVDSSVGTGSADQPAVNGYIPENPWNDSITDNPPGTASTNTAGTYDFGAGPTTLINAGGGGISSTISCTGGLDSSGNCLGYSGYLTPPYQTGLAPSIPADAFPPARYLPDISLFAGDGRQSPAVWAICSDSTVAQGDSTFIDCTPGPDRSYSVEGSGGTGAAAAAAAGMLAMVSESLGGSRLGLVNNTLYNLYADNAHNLVFHDIEAGNSAVPCTTGTLNCSGNNFLSGYDAAVGYDLASGMGSVDVSALVSAWQTVAFEGTSTSLSVNDGSTPVITHGDLVKLGAIVVSTALPGTTPTGSVAVIGIPDPSAPNQLSAAVGEQFTLTNGQGTKMTQTLPGGNYSLQAFYAGDATHSPSMSSLVGITVNPEQSALKLFLQVVDVNSSKTLGSTFPYGSFGFAYVQPTSLSGDFHGPATGSATLLNNGTTFSALDAPVGQTLNSAGRAAFPLSHVAPGSYQLSATYNGDSSYRASATTGTTAVTITKGPTTLTISPASSNLDASATETVTVTLTTDSTGDYPSGGIILSANGTSFQGTIQRVFTKINSVELVGTFQVRGSVLAGGSNTLTATYPGDTNYEGTTTGITLNVSGATGGTFTLTGPTGGMAIAASQTQASGTVAVASTGNFAGIVQLSCNVKPANEAAFFQCSVTPSVLLQAGASVDTTVTISTPASATAGGSTRSSGLKPLQFPFGKAGLLLCSGFLFIIPARRHTVPVVLAAAALLGTIGCGIQVTPVKSFTAVVTGTSGGTTVNLEIPIKLQ